VKILYLMHINWFWIRQRPQVIAEILAQRHSVRLLHYAMYRSQHRAGERSPPMPSQLVYRVPGPLKRASGLFEWLDLWWIEQQVLSAYKRTKPDCVWVLHPIYERATRRLGTCPVVYDCMDDHLEFIGQGTERLAQAERRLVARADLCVFSSATLAQRVNQRSPSRRQTVVNNAVSQRFMELAQQASVAAKAPPRSSAKLNAPTFGYFGTISHWFDWALVMRLLQAMPQARLQLVGPLETPVPQHERIEHLGVLAHADLVGFAQGCDILLMPFVVNRLIESVDPVKLYEYIALGVPSLAPRYAESERFEPFISLYRNHDEALALVKALLQRPPQPRAGALQFLTHNTWEARGAQLFEQLDALA